MPALVHDLEGLVRQEVERWRIPGAAVAVVAGDADPVVLTAGVVDVRTGAPVTDSTIFRFGSVTKVLTAALMLRAVEDGRLGLDDLVSEHIPEFRLGDATAADTLTIRHLLSKSDGIFDHVEGYGTDDGAVGRYVASLRDVGQVAPPGSLYSYSNTGPIIAGRVLEAVHGRPFDRVLDEELLRPAGLIDTIHIPDNIDIDPDGPVTVDGVPVATRHTYNERFEAAAGGGGQPPALDEPRAMAACGTTLGTTIGDAIRFAASTLPGRASVLSDASLAEMRRTQITLPELDLAAGLGWLTTPSRPWVLGHNGGSRPPGTYAQLTTVPDHGIAIAVLANAMTGGMLANAVLNAVLDANGVPPAEPLPAMEPVDVRQCAGTYERGHARITVTRIDDDTMNLTIAPGPHGDQDPKIDANGTYTRSETPWFAGSAPGSRFAFIRPDTTGRHTYIHDVRAARRID